MTYFDIIVKDDEIFEEDGTYIEADCGHEVYTGELIFTSAAGRTICPECLDDELFQLSLCEKAALLEYEWTAVNCG